MSDDKRRVVVALFAERRTVFWAKVRVEAPATARNREILEMFHDGRLPPFQRWEIFTDDPVSYCEDIHPRIVGRFHDEEPDIVFVEGKHGLEIDE